eukprot:1945494-Pyramimonas_sp.AAC.1
MVPLFRTRLQDRPLSWISLHGSAGSSVCALLLSFVILPVAFFDPDHAQCAGSGAPGFPAQVQQSYRGRRG